LYVLSFKKVYLFMDPYIGMIFAFAGNFSIRSFQMCSGQLMSIQQNTALFSILGATYGGDGFSTFALPDLRGRTLIHWGQGPGLANRSLGEVVGQETVVLTTSHLPSHNHNLQVSNSAPTTGTPANTTVFGKGPSTGSGPNAVSTKLYTTAGVDTALSPASIGFSGSNSPVSIMQPAVAVTYLIALDGLFPSRN
jgi:microcystin-dependent protein